MLASLRFFSRILEKSKTSLTLSSGTWLGCGRRDSAWDGGKMAPKFPCLSFVTSQRRLMELQQYNTVCLIPALCTGNLRLWHSTPGYGRFSIFINPFFSVTFLTLAQKYGFILAVPNIRSSVRDGIWLKNRHISVTWFLTPFSIEKLIVSMISFPRMSFHHVAKWSPFIFICSEYLVKNKYAVLGKGCD